MSFTTESNIYPADVVDDTADRAELQGLALYLQTRFFPALPTAYAPAALAAIRLCSTNGADRTLVLPDDLNPLPRAAGRTGTGRPSITAAELVTVLRLWDSVDTDQDEDPTIVESRGFDSETESLGLDDCLYWTDPSANCGGRVGTILADPTQPRIVICENHLNTQEA